MQISNLGKRLLTEISCFPQERVQVINGALSITRLALSDIGMYQCVAGNKYGEVYSNAELRVIGKLSRSRIWLAKADANIQDGECINKS